MLDDLLKLFSGISTMGSQSIENRRILLDNINGLEISTVNTPDMGFETAILDVNGVYPVERYPTRHDAIIGHNRWCKKAEKIKEVITLGYGGLTEEEKITLRRKDDKHSKFPSDSQM